MRIHRLGLLAAILVAGNAYAKTDLVYFGSTGVPPPHSFPMFTLPSPQDGIYAGRFDEATGKLTSLGQVAQLLRPSMVIAHGKQPILYAVNELGGRGPEHAQIVSYRFDPASGALTRLNVADAGGRGSNFASLDLATRTLFVASYTSGQVSTLALNPDDTVGGVASVDQHTGRGPNDTRQRGPHPHAAVLDPSRKFVLAPDLGNDRVYIYAFDHANRSITPAAEPFVSLPPGSGPHHLQFLPGGKFVVVISEMSAQLFVLAWDSAHGTLTLKGTTDLEGPDFTGMKSAADFLVSRDGKTLYVCNRSDDSIDSFSVNAATGKLTALQRLPAGGTLPWNLAIDPSGRWLLLANNGSSQVAIFKIGKNGRLTASGVADGIFSPSSISFAGSR